MSQHKFMHLAYLRLAKAYQFIHSQANMLAIMPNTAVDAPTAIPYSLIKSDNRFPATPATM